MRTSSPPNAVRRDRFARLARQTKIGRLAEIDGLARAVEAVEGRAGRGLGWAGLRRGGLHEWFGLADGSPEPPADRSVDRSVNGPAGRFEARGPRSWAPPLCLLSDLAACALRAGGCRRRVVWIGRRVWPYPRTLLGRGGSATAEDLLARSVFIDPPDDSSRLWAIDLAARCPAVTAIVADGSHLTMAASRRLQLAAEAGEDEGGSGTGGEKAPLLLLTRPPREAAALSAAATRWWVSPAPSSGAGPCWSVSRLRAKGAAARGSGRERNEAGMRRWMLEWDHAQGVVAASADVVGGPGASASSVRRGGETARSARSRARRTA
jgi:protein ImuA